MAQLGSRHLRYLRSGWATSITSFNPGRRIVRHNNLVAHVRDGSCVTSNAGPRGGCITVREMKESPSQSSTLPVSGSG
jgi:hypothetical protein